MTLNIAIQMDPLESINPKADTTLRIALEAQARGYTLWHYIPDRLSWQDGKISAEAHRVTLFDDDKRWFEFKENTRIDLSEMDVVLLRQDPPFNMAYMTTTYLLERLEPKTLVVNNPASVRNLPEKWFPTQFLEFMPPTLISSHAKEIEDFRAVHKDIVIKPFYGFGGEGVFRVAPGETLILPTLDEPVMAQKFLPEVKDQDRRIILIDGKVEAVFGRLPVNGDIRANLRLGGTAAKAELSKRQREICDKVGPVLKAHGLLFVGLDVIGDWLTEINITSPTGFVPTEKLYGIKLAGIFWDAVEKLIPRKR
jgi:glutathione synthase